MPRPSANQILLWWMESHGPLSLQHRRSLLGNRATKDLCALPAEIVEPAVRKNMKLKQALAAAKQANHAPSLRSAQTSRSTRRTAPSDAGRYGEMPAKARTVAEQEAMLRTHKSGNPQRYPVRPERANFRDNVSEPQVRAAPQGRAGTSAGYHSGLARNPGTPEVAHGDRCSQCEAFIPSGASHDCS